MKARKEISFPAGRKTVNGSVCFSFRKFCFFSLFHLFVRWLHIMNIFSLIKVWFGFYIYVPPFPIWSKCLYALPLRLLPIRNKIMFYEIFSSLIFYWYLRFMKGNPHLKLILLLELLNSVSFSHLSYRPIWDSLPLGQAMRDSRFGRLPRQEMRPLSDSDHRRRVSYLILEFR